MKSVTSATGRAWIEINLDNLRHNAEVLQELMPRGCRLMAVVKANAYGHGAVLVSSWLQRWGVTAFGVATVDEGIELRRHGIKGEILVFGYTDPARVKEIKKYGLTQTVVDASYAEELDRRGIPVDVHIKIDTGMHRLGYPSDDFESIAGAFNMRCLRIRGMYTHLCCADNENPGDREFTENQIEKFYSVVDYLKTKNIKIPKLHIQSSYGLLNYPKLKCDYARIGIALYGGIKTGSTYLKPDLKPVMFLKARVVHIQTVKTGESVGYGRTFTAKRDSLIAVVSVGYDDGYPRTVRSGCALVNGVYAPLAGRVCMDQLAVDITGIPGVKTGDTVTLIGDGRISAPDVAEHYGSISNELFCRMGERVPVIAVHAGNKPKNA